MKTFAVLLTLVPNALELRQPYREAHLRHFRELRDAGRIVLAGPWADKYDGALVMFRAESRDEVEQILRDDPYHKANIWPEIIIREWDVITWSQEAFLAAVSQGSGAT